MQERGDAAIHAEYIKLGGNPNDANAALSEFIRALARIIARRDHKAAQIRNSPDQLESRCGGR